MRMSTITKELILSPQVAQLDQQIVLNINFGEIPWTARDIVTPQSPEFFPLFLGRFLMSWKISRWFHNFVDQLECHGVRIKPPPLVTKGFIVFTVVLIFIFQKYFEQKGFLCKKFWFLYNPPENNLILVQFCCSPLLKPQIFVRFAVRFFCTKCFL